jgi:hypothetical protein
MTFRIVAADQRGAAKHQAETPKRPNAETPSSRIEPQKMKHQVSPRGALFFYQFFYQFW